MDNQEHQLLDNFFAGIAKESITSFIHTAMTTPQLMAGLKEIDLLPETVAAFARKHGFSFSAADLESFLDDRIEKELDGAELELRRSFGARFRRGEIPSPVFMNDPCAGKERSCDVTEGFSLDRRNILKGGVTALRQVPAIHDLVLVFRDILTTHFEPHDPLRAHGELSPEVYKACVVAAYDALLADGRIPPIVAAFMDQMGMDTEKTVFEWPGFRLTFPHGAEPPGYYRTTPSGALPPHRDTWYGSPNHQINLWGPIYPLAENESLRILSDYHYRSIKNSSRGYDVWRNAVGLNLIPMLRENVDSSNPVAPSLEVGDVMAFAAHQLHHSALNRRETTRITFECRLLCQEDEGAEYAPPNIDFHGFGEIYKGWYASDGQEIMRTL